MSAATTYIAPRDVATQLGVDLDAVYTWLRSGELRGVNVAIVRNAKRPRWRVAQADLDVFLASRAAGPPAPRIRRRRETAGIIQFFTAGAGRPAGGATAPAGGCAP